MGADRTYGSDGDVWVELDRMFAEIPGISFGGVLSIYPVLNNGLMKHRSFIV